MRRLSSLARRSSQRDYGTIAAAMLCAAVGIGFVLAGISERRAVQPIEGGVVTTGRVVGHVTREYTDEHGTHTDDYPVIEFTDRQERVHRFESRVMSGKRSGAVKVRYDPDEPTRAQWVDQPGKWLWIVFVIAGSLCVLIGAGLLVRRWAVRRRRLPGSRSDSEAAPAMPPEGGEGPATGSVFTAQVLVVVQTWGGGQFQTWPDYELFDEHWRPLGVARRPGPEGGDKVDLLGGDVDPGPPRSSTCGERCC